MPFLKTRLAVLAFFCLLAPCLLPHPASAAQVQTDGVQNADEEFSQPVVLPPMRKPQTQPAALRGSILETLLRVEAEARREAEAEERLASEARGVEDRARLLREQQEARENARLRQERGQARIKALADTLKTAAPPPVAVTPAKKDWPLPALMEDPAWNTLEISSLYHRRHSEAEIRSVYRSLLSAAVNGNPRAMVALSDAYQRWGAGISASFAVLHPPMHNGDYWRTWAVRLTSPDWLELRFAELAITQEERLGHYRLAANYANGEALYRLALLEDRPELLVQAALAGHPQACSQVAFNMMLGTDGFPASPRQASFYWWRGALAGDLRCLLVCSELFYQGQQGFPKDERRSYLFALLASEAAQRRSANGQYSADDSASGSLLPTVERHLASLGAAMKLSQDDLWKLGQELEIFRAAPAEEMQSRLIAASARRAAVLRELADELFAVREVLGASGSEASERQLLYRLEQAMAGGEAEQAQRASLLMDEQRRHDNRYFFWFGIIGLVVVFGGYVAMRLHLYGKVVRLMSVTEGRA